MGSDGRTAVDGRASTHDAGQLIRRPAFEFGANPQIFMRVNMLWIIAPILLPSGGPMAIVPSPWFTAADSRVIGTEPEFGLNSPGGHLRAVCGEMGR